MNPVDCYFESVLGLPVDGLGGAVRTDLRQEGQPPFLHPCAAMELLREGRAYRSVSPLLRDDAETLPLEALGRVAELCVFSPRGGWTPRPECRAVPLDQNCEISGAMRLPPAWRGWGIQVDEKFVSWAAASPTGQVWNVTVETHPGYRRRGLAADCVCALTADLTNIGITPLYLCDARNAASANTAKAAGYAEYGLWRRVIAKDLEGA